MQLIKRHLKIKTAFCKLFVAAIFDQNTNVFFLFSVFEAEMTMMVVLTIALAHHAAACINEHE